MTRARLFFLTAAVGLVFVACTPGSAGGGSEEVALCRAPAPVVDAPFGDPAVCANYEPEEPGAAVTIGFVNRRDEDVVLHGVCNGYFRLLGSPSGYLAHGPVTCLTELPPCEWMLEPEGAGCLATCASPPSIRLAPGMRFETEWQPLLMIEAELPAECADDPAFSGACMATRRPIAGEYLLQARFSAAGECVDGCDCEPGADGWCELLEPPNAPIEALRDVPALYDGVCAAVEFVIE